MALGLENVEKLGLKTKTTFIIKKPGKDFSFNDKKHQPGYESMKLVGQMFPLCPEEAQYSNKLNQRPTLSHKSKTTDVEFDYCPDEDISYGETTCSFGLPYNDHNYGVPTGLTPPSSPPHLRENLPTLLSNPPSLHNSPMKVLPERIFNVTTIHNKSNNSKESVISEENNSNGGNSDVDDKESNQNPTLVINSEKPIDQDKVDRDNCVSRWEMGLRGGNGGNYDWHSAPGANSQHSVNGHSKSSDFGNPYNLQHMLAMSIETDMKVIEVPEQLCVSPSQLSDLDSDLDCDVGNESTGTSRRERSRNSRKTSIDPEPVRSFSQITDLQPVGVAEIPLRAVIRCACGYTHNDANMITCKRCNVWQHLDCMTLGQGILLPFPYTCEVCETRRVDYRRAVEIQRAKMRGEPVPERLLPRSHLPSNITIKDEDKESPEDEVVMDNDSKEDSKDNLTLIHSELETPHSPPRTSKRKQDLTAKAYMPIDDKVKRRSSTEHNNDSTVRTNSSSAGTGTCHSASAIIEKLKRSDTDFSHGWKKKKVDQQKLEDDAWKRGQSMDTMANPLGSAWTRDYQEVDQNTYTEGVIQEARKYGDPKKNSNYCPLNYLSRAPLCKMVIFDHNFKGLEAACRLRPFEMVIEFRGHMMLMVEYESLVDIYHQYNRFAIIYPNYGSNGIVIDASEFGNEARFMRRSCRPNCKLEMIQAGGNLHIMIETTHEIMMGGELTIPFDVDYMSCQYPVECACGKTRCPVLRWTRKLENRRVVPTLDYKKYIESQLQVLSRPMCQNNSATTLASSLPSSANRSTMRNLLNKTTTISIQDPPHEVEVVDLVDDKEVEEDTNDTPAFKPIITTRRQAARLSSPVIQNKVVKRNQGRKAHL